MIRSELVKQVRKTHSHLEAVEATAVVAVILDTITGALAKGRRVELRGFGAFSTRARTGRIGRNPRTGAPVPVAPKRVPYFKAGKEMRARLNLHPEGESE